MFFRLCCVMLLASTASLPMAAAFEPPRVDGLRSELWRMEYREQDDDSGQQVRANGENGEPAVDMDVAAQRVVGDIVSTAVANEGLTVSTPGQAELSDLNAETPIADWKIDEGSIGAVFNKPEEFKNQATSWELSRLNAGAANAQPLSTGPSMVTFLVAVVACVVVTGALFSGKS